jgi:hypothetical protein
MNGIAGLNVAISALTVPIYVFGKRSKSWVSFQIMIWRQR